MKIDLAGKVALVTASTAGIGFAIAKGLAESGAEVILNGRSEQSVNAAIARLQNEVPGAKARPAIADLSDARRRSAAAAGRDRRRYSGQ